MRPLLLDTCAVLKLANGEFGKFSRSAMKAMREADILYVSPISEWEISLKWKQGVGMGDIAEMEARWHRTSS